MRFVESKRILDEEATGHEKKWKYTLKNILIWNYYEDHIRNTFANLWVLEMC